MSVTTRRRFAAVALASVAVLAVATACGDDGDDGGSNEQITLRLDIFGEQGFGYDELITKYQADHPNIKVEQRGKGLGAYPDYDTRLTQWMASGAGAGDVVALEEGQIINFKGQADKFVDLRDHGAESMKNDFLPWKWEQGSTADGKLIGLGTDVGGMAVCYRSDLFKAAGLPTDREQVGALWPTWEAFIETGKRFDAGAGNAKFVDAATNVFNTILMQTAGNGTGYTYFDKSDKFVMADNSDVKTAWDTTVKMIEGGLSARLDSFSDEWNTGFKQAQFATVVCPAWMTGVIEGAAGADAAGKWDIAKAPGNGGNWGGSFLAVTKQSDHPKEAAELAKYLTTPDAQKAAFQAVGNLPSTVTALDDPTFLATKNDYFTDAPTGEIFGTGAKELKPVYLGSKNGAVRTVVENALRSIEQGQRNSSEAWADGLKEGENAAK